MNTYPQQHHHHREEHYEGSDVLRDIVIGMSDGLTVPFALAAGMSAAVDGNGIILTAGFAEIIAGSIAMGLGGYLAGKTEIQHYDSEIRREYQEIERFPEIEKQEVREVFAAYGLSETSQNAIAEELSKQPDQWVNFMMRFELGLEKPNINRARTSALTIGLSYIAGGIVPLSPYLFTDTPDEGLVCSCIITLLFLFIFGFAKSRLLGQPAVMGALKITGIGALAAGAAYLITQLFAMWM